jgi:hypothetical protein
MDNFDFKHDHKRAGFFSLIGSKAKLCEHVVVYTISGINAVIPNTKKCIGMVGDCKKCKKTKIWTDENTIW